MFSEVVTVAERFEVVYNLEEVTPGLFLPTAYIVSLDKEGYLAHIKQKALTGRKAIKSYLAVQSRKV